MEKNDDRNLWKLLWDYDPNGLVVVDLDLKIKVVNPAFCRMFKVDRESIIDRPIAEVLLKDVESLRRVWDTKQVIRGREKEYPQNDLYVREVIFPIEEENIIACIIVDITEEWQRRQELLHLKSETIKNVNEVVDNQMKVAQEIAGLLGETTATTKVSLLKILSTIEQDI